MKPARVTLLGVLAALVGLLAPAPQAQAQQPQFKAGIGIRDVSPTNFPVLVNAMFTERVGTKVADPLNARALVLDDGETKIALCAVDSCMVPRDLLDLAKKIVEDAAHIPI